jgi:hypothetical protein
MTSLKEFYTQLLVKRFSIKPGCDPGVLYIMCLSELYASTELAPVKNAPVVGNEPTVEIEGDIIAIPAIANIKGIALLAKVLNILS